MGPLPAVIVDEVDRLFEPDDDLHGPARLHPADDDVDRAQAGGDAVFVPADLHDEAACTALVEAYVRMVGTVIWRATGRRDVIEDLTQETFLRVFKALEYFDARSRLSTWIYTIASNLAKNELRNRSRNPLVLFQTLTASWDDDHRPLQFEDSSMRPDDLYRKRHLQELVERAADELPEHHREVFILREIEGKTYEEISDITGVNLGTVKSRLNRARNNFAQLISPMLD